MRQKIVSVLLTVALLGVPVVANGLDIADTPLNQLAISADVLPASDLDVVATPELEPTPELEGETQELLRVPITADVVDVDVVGALAAEPYGVGPTASDFARGGSSNVENGENGPGALDRQVYQVYVEQGGIIEGEWLFNNSQAESPIWGNFSVVTPFGAVIDLVDREPSQFDNNPVGVLATSATTHSQRLYFTGATIYYACELRAKGLQNADTLADGTTIAPDVVAYHLPYARTTTGCDDVSAVNGANIVLGVDANGVERGLPAGVYSVIVWFQYSTANQQCGWSSYDTSPVGGWNTAKDTTPFDVNHCESYRSEGDQTINTAWYLAAKDTVGVARTGRVWTNSYRQYATASERYIQRTTGTLPSWASTPWDQGFYFLLSTGTIYHSDFVGFNGVNSALAIDNLGLVNRAAPCTSINMSINYDNNYGQQLCPQRSDYKIFFEFPDLTMPQQARSVSALTLLGGTEISFSESEYQRLMPAVPTTAQLAIDNPEVTEENVRTHSWVSDTAVPVITNQTGTVKITLLQDANVIRSVTQLLVVGQNAVVGLFDGESWDNSYTLSAELSQSEAIYLVLSDVELSGGVSLDLVRGISASGLKNWSWNHSNMLSNPSQPECWNNNNILVAPCVGIIPQLTGQNITASTTTPNPFSWATNLTSGSITIPTFGNIRHLEAWYSEPNNATAVLTVDANPFGLTVTKQAHLGNQTLPTGATHQSLAGVYYSYTVTNTGTRDVTFTISDAITAPTSGTQTIWDCSAICVQVTGGTLSGGQSKTYYSQPN